MFLEKLVRTVIGEIEGENKIESRVGTLVRKAKSK